MYKKVIITCTSLIIILSLVFFYFFNGTSNENIVELDTIDSSFLDDQVAVTYYSTTIDSDQGKGFIIFIDHQGDTVTAETEGLELGRLGYNGKNLFFQDQTKNYTVTNALNTEDRNDYQHTGDYVGTLSDDTFFSIFNSGMGIDGDTYQSDIYWYSHEDFKKDVLPFYIESRGHDEHLIYTLHREDLDDNEFILSQTELTDQANIKQLMTWEPDQEVLPISNLHVNDDSLYYIGESYEPNGVFFQLIEWNLATKSVNEYLVTEPMSNEEHYESIPFDSQKSAHFYNDMFYFIDGLGCIYTIDIKTGQTTERFVIDDTARHGDFVQIEWKEDHLYVFYNYSDDRLPSGLDTYHIETGETIDSLEINGMEEIVGKNKGLFSYDLIILD